MNAQLQEHINALQKEKESDQVDTYKGGHYTNEGSASYTSFFRGLASITLMK